jgi:hypothetical protein
LDRARVVYGVDGQAFRGTPNSLYPSDTVHNAKDLPPKGEVVRFGLEEEAVDRAERDIG